MASLADVQRMLKQGDRKRAALILQRVLKENPSADAWYLAARLTKSADKTQTYLQNALKLDPNHARSQQALAKIAQARATAGTDTETVADTAPEDQREPWPTWLRVLAPLTIMLVVVIATSAVLNLLSPVPDPPAPTDIPPLTQPPVSDNSGNTGNTGSADSSDTSNQAQPGNGNTGAANASAGGGRAVFPTDIPDPNASPTPTPRPISIQPVTAQVVADHFEANFFGAALNSTTIETANAETTWTIDFESGASAQLLLYPSVNALTNDEPFLAQQLQEDRALNTYHTLALLYPQDLSPGDLISLSQWLDRTPITADEQATLQEILAEVRAEGQ